MLTKAQQAKNETEQSEKNEKEKLGDMEDEINKYSTGIEVEQVTDENPGELEVSEDNSNTYVINSIEDLVFFANDVTEGNTYEGKIVKLGLSLDFKSNKSYVSPFRTDYGKYGYEGELKTLLTTGNGFIPIGSIEDQAGEEDYSNAKAFFGEFDGQNNTISNMYINQSVVGGVSYQYFGLFTHNFGIIKNLKVNGDININVATNNVCVGLISGLVIGENSIIENCYSSGKININGKSLSTDYYIASGGIAGQTNQPDGHIKKCCNVAEIMVEGERIYIGGIVGSNNGGTVLMSYNTGKITGNGNDEIYTRCGGVVGTSTGTIEYCYNIGEVKGNKKTGGILGVVNLSNIMNCQYNNKGLLGTSGLTKEQEEANNIIRNENLTVEEILTILKNINI